MAPRAFWTGNLRLSLVTIPVGLYPATSSERKIEFHQIHEPTGKRIRYQKVAPGVGPVENEEIIKGYEYEKGKYVLLDQKQIDERDKILAEAERAVSLDPDNADGYFVRGYALTYNGNLPAGREQFELALKSNPNHADAWLFLADLEVFEGDPDAALRSVDMAFQLNPYPHAAYYWLRGFALYAARRYEDAVATLQHKSCREAGAQRILAAALAQLGRHDEAREAVLRFLKTVPQFRTESWAKTQPFRKADDLQHFIDGYIKAGLPA